MVKRKRPIKKRTKRKARPAAPAPEKQLVEPYWKGVQVQRGTARAAVPRRQIQD